MIIKYINPVSQSVVLLPRYLLESIFRIASQHYPVEFGGIFTGYKLDNLLSIVDFEVPNKFQSTGTKFTREADDLNKYLQDIYEVSLGKIEYLGEWHSHPAGSTQFSSKDLQSIGEIAFKSETKNKNPLLLIIGLGQKKHISTFYQFIEGNLIKLKSNNYDKTSTP